MRYDRSRNFPRKALSTTEVRAALRTRAHQLAPLVAAATSVSERGGWASGERTEPGVTKGSTRVESGHRSASGDRPAVRIVQDGAAAPEEFRQNRDYMQRALGGGA